MLFKQAKSNKWNYFCFRKLHLKHYKNHNVGFFISKFPTFTAIMLPALTTLVKGNSISFNGTKGYDLGNHPKKFL